MARLVHLHAHSTYSFLDAYGTPEQMVARAQQLGHRALAVTDHGNVVAHVPLWLATKGTDVKPIFGCELYLAQDHTSASRFDESLGVNALPHLTVLAGNAEGYRNLLHLQRLSWFEGLFAGKPRVDLGLLEKHARGLVFLSGCAFGNPTRLLWDNGERPCSDRAYDACVEWLDEARTRLGHALGFYVELIPQPDFDQCTWTLGTLAHAARHLSLPTVMTADSHFTTADRYQVQNVMLRRSLNVKEDEECPVPIPDYQYLCEAHELFARAVTCREENPHRSLPTLTDEEIWAAIERSAEVADLIQAQPEPVTFRELTPARFWALKPQDDPGEVLWIKVGEGFQRRKATGQIAEASQWEYFERAKREWQVLTRKGFADYILTVADVVNHVKGLNGLVMLRGSAGGCLLLWLLGASETDPIKHRLSFERFYDDNRPDPPDVDADFEQGFRDRAVNYVRRRYGHQRVAQIAALSALQAKQALADVAWVLDVPRSEYEALSNALDSSDSDVEGQLHLLGQAGLIDPESDLARLTSQLAGQVRQASVHACGILLTEEPLDELIGVMQAKDGFEVAQLDKRSIKKLGGLKMDLLSVSAYDVVGEAIRRVAGDDHEKQAALLREFYALDLELPDVLALADKGALAGVFQLEGGAATRVARKTGVKCFEDLVAVSGLCRPGPAEWVDTYRANRDDRDRLARYLGPLNVEAQKIIAPTNGILLYQEQVMALARMLAGFEWADVHELRKGVCDKLGLDPVTGDAWREKWGTKFIGGCVERGVSQVEAEFWWHAVQSHGGYSFNRSHCVTYGVIGYWTLYLKARHTHDFYLTALQHEPDKVKKKRLILEYRRITGRQDVLRLIDPNMAADRFTLDERGMTASLQALPGVGPATAAKVEAALAPRRPNNTPETFLAALPKALRAKMEESGVLGPVETWRHQLLVLLAPWWPVVALEARHERWVQQCQAAGLSPPITRLSYEDQRAKVEAGNKSLSAFGYVTAMDLKGKHKALVIEDGKGLPTLVRLKKDKAAQLVQQWHREGLAVGDFVRVAGYVPEPGTFIILNDEEHYARVVRLREGRHVVAQRARWSHQPQDREEVVDDDG